MIRGVIQARMGSSRLRGKSLAPVAGVPLLKRVIDSVNYLHVCQSVMVATSNKTEDDTIAAYCEYLGVAFIRGDEFNVFDRFMRASLDLADNDILLRFTADNPFYTNPQSQQIIRIHRDNNNDYTCVDGLSHTTPEVMNVGALRMALKNPEMTDYDKEHVTPFIRRNTDLFKVQEVPKTQLELSERFDHLLTIDTAEERGIIEQLIIDTKIDYKNLQLGKLYAWLTKNNY